MIRLRKIEPSDLPFLYLWENDDSAWLYSDTHNPLSKQDLRAYIESTTGDIYRDGQLRLMIINAPDADGTGGEACGCIDFFDFDARNRKAAIGLYVAPNMRGKGIGHEAVRQLLHYAFDFLQLRMVYACVATRNTICTNIYKDFHFKPSSPLTAWTLEDEAVIWQMTQQTYSAQQ